MLTVLGGLTAFERDLMRARTTEGRARAKARGVKMGRPPKLTAQETLAEIGRSYNVSGWTIARLRA
jgi:DNA invertase Pin-like site-specific DNA recombinase